MSDPTPPAAPEPHPFQKFTDFARRIIAVPKVEADKKEQQWREDRQQKRRAKKD